jgi:hypothetical protein
VSPWLWAVLALLVVAGVLTWLLLRNRGADAAPQGHHVAGAGGAAPASPPTTESTDGP